MDIEWVPNHAGRRARVSKAARSLGDRIASSLRPHRASEELVPMRVTARTGSWLLLNDGRPHLTAARRVRA